METDMTKGKPMNIIIGFAIPMFIGNLFQQFYNIVDTIIVGRFVGKEALAAVGSSFAIMTFVTSILIGLSMGASALFSQLFGAKQYEELKKAISTSFIFILVVSITLTVITSLFMNQIIHLFQMPVETRAYAANYLRFIFAGLIFSGVYNSFSFLLRAVGDSKSPLYFLILSAIINIILDLFFVVILNMEVTGVALATFIAQGVSAISCAIYTIKRMNFLEFNREDIIFHRQMFKKIASYSILTAVQQSASSFGMMMVQGLVNTFGAIVMAAFAAASKIDSFANIPMQDFGNALSTYVAQNKGANNTKRIREGIRGVSKIIIIFSLGISILVFVFAPQLVLIFVKKEALDVIEVSVYYLRIVCVTYILLGFLQMFYGFYRGLGEVKVSIMLTFVSQVTRVVLAYGLALTPLGFTGICLAIPIGWFLSDALGVAMYKKIMIK
ncbi:MATE family efflux transporter [Clostridium sp. MSJ-4]|uniref:Probable multidrug resistance protein NorM n=1 Tax=Clostridium simiarum TaxID=2841506 RepID=A0ABS6EZF2_9CLOT|nr:MATE family efflux transporter [Clostridium simiarum]MBU5591601.1 MATE family efflux transporter [Clostridium simiarum]